MAKRFGGKYSPDGDTPDGMNGQDTSAHWDKAEVNPVGARANILFIPAIPLVAMTFNDGAVALSTALAAAVSWTLAAWLLRGGLEAEAEYHSRKVARRPAIPRKIFSSVLTGVGCALAVITHQDDFGIIAPALFGAIASGLHLASFGLDPMTDKGMEGIDTFQQDRVARVVDEAEKHLRAMTDAILRSGDRQMEVAVERFQTTARDLIRTVEEDPRDLSSARKYLGVYLLGARDATVKFADISSRAPDEQARADYSALLADMTDNFAARTQKLLTDDRTDLNIEIDVLRDRLAREGVRLDNGAKQD